MTDKQYTINHKIKDKELRVITGEGENLGVLATPEALKIAQDRKLDLVVISPMAQPPVAKILDFKKFLYQENKEKSKALKRSKKSETKEIMFKPFTGEGDLKWQMDRGRAWLSEGNRVKVWVVMKGRAAAYPELCFDKVNKFVSELADVGKPESAPDRKGNIISVMLLPK